MGIMKKNSSEDIVGKEENAGNQHFLLFPQCFKKAPFFKIVKIHDYDHVVQGKSKDYLKIFFCLFSIYQRII